MGKKVTEKEKIETYQVGDDVITIKRTQVAQYRPYGDGVVASPERSKYEVLINGELRGWLVFPQGWGQSWQLYTLREKSYPSDSVDGVFGTSGVYHAVTAPTVIPGLQFGVQWESRAHLIENIIPALKKGFLPSQSEVDAQIAADEARRLQEKQQEEIDRIAHAKKRAEEDRQAEEYRCETLDGLTSIKDKYFSQLTNLEQVAIQRAIEIYATKKRRG